MNTLSSLSFQCTGAFYSKVSPPVVKFKNRFFSKNQAEINKYIAALVSSCPFFCLNSYRIIKNFNSNESIGYPLVDITANASLVGFGIYSVIQILHIQKKAKDEALITEFLTDPFPSWECFKKIASDEGMISKIIERDKTALNKKNPERNSLLSYQSYFYSKIEIIKLLLNNAKWDSEEIYVLIRYHMEFNDEIFKSIINPYIIKLLTPNHQFELMLRAPSEDAIRTLKSAGLNIDTVGDNNLTPLQHICSKDYIYTTPSGALLAYFLLKEGADAYSKTQLKVFSHEDGSYKEYELNAFEIAKKRSKDPMLIRVLEQHIADSKVSKNAELKNSPLHESNLS